MSTYELHINGMICDLPDDSAVSLVYQSGIFSDLDSIQSNRSHNIDLPITPRNTLVIQCAQRPDIDSDAPYVKLPAALYQDGVPLFTSGYAVITGISDVISVTLTWGNVDNFDPLFDSDMRDLSQTLYDMGLGSIEWNSNSQLVTMPAESSPPKQAGFFAVNFGQGVQNGGDGMRYMHPCISVDAVLSAIEKFNGITIDGKERLYGQISYPNLLPLVSKNANHEYQYAYKSKGESPISINLYFDGDDQAGIVGYPGDVPNSIMGLKSKGASVIQLSISSSDTNQFYVKFNWPNYGKEIEGTMVLSVIGWRGRGEPDVLYKQTSIYNTKKGKVWFNNLSLTIKNASEYKGFDVQFESPDVLPDEYLVGDVLIYGDFENFEVNFPNNYYFGVNLPDMSQGEFLSSLLTQAGLFAYADKDTPDTIKLMSADELIDNVLKSNFVDWSSKVLLNDRHLVDMPDSSEFIVGDYARKNTLDYDNDDDVTTDTAGEILIDNINLDKEAELASLPFSASENQVNTEGEEIALVPIYITESNGDIKYDEVSPRILTQFPTANQQMAGMFAPKQRFGGENGIVATKYKGLRDILRRLLIINVRAKLSALDLMNIDYKTPVFISQFGQFFGIYQIETNENGICDCKLVKIPVAGNIPVELYLKLNGLDQDLIIDNISAAGDSGIGAIINTNGTPYIVSGDSRLTASIVKDGPGFSLEVSVPENPDPSPKNYDPIVIGIREDDTKRRSAILKQAAAATSYYLTLDGLDGDQMFVNQPAAGVTLQLALATNGSPKVISKDARLAVGLPLGSGTLMITVPRNTGSTQLQYDPVVLGLNEDSSVRVGVGITQKAAGHQVVGYLVTLANATGAAVTFQDSKGELHQIHPGFNETVTIGGVACIIALESETRSVIITATDLPYNVWEATDITADKPYTIETGIWLEACAGGVDWFTVG